MRWKSTSRPFQRHRAKNECLCVLPHDVGIALLNQINPVNLLYPCGFAQLSESLIREDTRFSLHVLLEMCFDLKGITTDFDR